jgi:hypothetical protein
MYAANLVLLLHNAAFMHMDRGPGGQPLGVGTPVEWARSVLEHHIDAPKGKDGSGGMGGWADERWIPFEVECWRDRKVGKEWPDHIRDHYTKLADEGEWLLRSKGVDGYSLFPDLTPVRQGNLFGW